MMQRYEEAKKNWRDSANKFINANTLLRASVAALDDRMARIQEMEDQVKLMEEENKALDQILADSHAKDQIIEGACSLMNQLKIEEKLMSRDGNNSKDQVVELRKKLEDKLNGMVKEYNESYLCRELEEVEKERLSVEKELEYLEEHKRKRAILKQTILDQFADLERYAMETEKMEQECAADEIKIAELEQQKMAKEKQYGDMLKAYDEMVAKRPKAEEIFAEMPDEQQSLETLVSNITIQAKAAPVPQDPAEKSLQMDTSAPPNEAATGVTQELSPMVLQLLGNFAKTGSMDLNALQQSLTGQPIQQPPEAPKNPAAFEFKMPENFIPPKKAKEPKKLRKSSSKCSTENKEKIVEKIPPLTAAKPSSSRDDTQQAFQSCSQDSTLKKDSKTLSLKKLKTEKRRASTEGISLSATEMTEPLKQLSVPPEAPRPTLTKNQRKKLARRAAVTDEDSQEKGKLAEKPSKTPAVKKVEQQSQSGSGAKKPEPKGSQEVKRIQILEQQVDTPAPPEPSPSHQQEPSPGASPMGSIDVDGSELNFDMEDFGDTASGFGGVEDNNSGGDFFSSSSSSTNAQGAKKGSAGDTFDGWF